MLKIMSESRYKVPVESFKKPNINLKKVYRHGPSDRSFDISIACGIRKITQYWT